MPSDPGTALPSVKTEVPGRRSQELVDSLARHECPAVTARRARRAESLGSDNDDPVVWESAVGATVCDVDGNRFVDVTSGFGVALLGHRHPEVVSAASAQAEVLVHAMGDAWPDVSRIRLLEEIAQVTPGDLTVSILGLSGSDAVDGCIKTAVLATGRPGIITFDGGYHGLSLGTLALQQYKESFKVPFQGIAHPHVYRLPWACDPAEIKDLMAKERVGLVLVEPVQGRGGIRPAPSGWLAEVAAITRDGGALFGLDEIQSGMGRTGDWFACEHDEVIPDLMCIGKALGGGYPISACIGSPEVMACWGLSSGEALHTQTFLGHPIGCAAARATLRVMRDEAIPEQVRQRGEALHQLATTYGFTTRGRGLMRAVPLPVSAFASSRALLQRGFISLPAGADDDALCLTPPVCITDEQLDALFKALRATVTEMAS
jgi:4-aminobutyrate aminotransferase / (S)-3-amino-2-methylpropionate transaminase / 5-aminovalerate transaminase